MNAKNINVFLIDGKAEGRIKCSLLNWTGVVYKIPRTKLDDTKEHSHLKHSGVYFLFGTDDVSNPKVYIGQASNRKNGKGIANRLKEHLKDEDYWIDAVVVTTNDNIFGPTEITYLEYMFCRLAKESNRYDIKNDKIPHAGNITEEKEAELKEYIHYVKLIMGILGYNIFAPVINEDKEPIFYIKSKDIEARGRRTNDGFLVLKDSSIVKSPTNSCPESTKQLRNKYSSNISKPDYMLKKDILFSSPSSAACFVLYSSENGRDKWKTSSGKSLKEIETEN